MLGYFDKRITGVAMDQEHFINECTNIYYLFGVSLGFLTTVDNEKAKLVGDIIDKALESFNKIVTAITLEENRDLKTKQEL